MDDAFELLIYILFIAVSIIGGLYKNYAKKKAEEKKRQYKDTEVSNPSSNQGAPFEEYQAKRNPFEEFIKQQLEGNSPDSEMEIEEPPIEVEHSEPENPYMKYSSSRNEGMAVFEDTSVAMLSDDSEEIGLSAIVDEPDFFEEEKKEIIKELSLVDNFDAKSAVIYSEILKRPDF